MEYRCMNGYVQQSGSEELACVQNDWEGESLRCRSKYIIRTLCMQVHNQHLYWQLYGFQLIDTSGSDTAV